jgi:1-acyl-sn-glycerol-3-phosphate acyltransferase
MARSRTTQRSQGLLRFASRLMALGVFRIRCEGRECVPASGGGLLLSNHQSNLDPYIIGFCCDRLLSYVARRTLFRFAPFGWLITWLGAIPIDREGGGVSGLKETLKRLKQGDLVLLFPEGTRTPDGQMRPLKPGFCALARRCELPLVPLALDGAYEAWPRQQRLPRPSVVHVRFGQPITPAEVATLSDDELVAEVERRVRACHAAARASRLRAKGWGLPIVAAPDHVID